MSDSLNLIRENTGLRIKEPPKYQVVFHNDDFTTMELVVKILLTVFHKTESEACQLMMDVHRHGSRAVGSYSIDIASSKRAKALEMAALENAPLRITIRPA